VNAADTTLFVANLLCVKACIRVSERSKAYRHTCGTAGNLKGIG